MTGKGAPPRKSGGGGAPQGTFAARRGCHFAPLRVFMRIIADPFLRGSCGDIAMGFEYGGLLGLIILVADIWAIVKILQGGGSTGSKVLWIVLILILPVVGLVLWLLLGRRGRLA
ncbi:PLDc N-terminal domain-containing protein [Pseudolabrys sp.]|uniref:PLDc N-terminal domain-containing protein n=1 Tax=Pseudolabrys sp. TaxID=1960880 RepID=UPI003D11F97C